MLTRRKLLTRIVKLFTVVGAGLTAIPFVRSILPTFEEDLSMEVDISDLAINSSKIVDWRGRRIYVYKRSRNSLELLNNAEPESLKDPESVESKQPAFARNAYRSIRPDIFVAFSYCTHLGCEIALETSEANQAVGFQCPCHQSNYDHSGRVLTDQPAPYNLEVPNYKFVSNNMIRLLPSKV